MPFLAPSRPDSFPPIDPILIADVKSKPAVKFLPVPVRIITLIS
jgi:hypothetical protein